MWRLYWHITDGYWKDDLCSPDDILHFWLHIPQVIKIFKNNKNEKKTLGFIICCTVHGVGTIAVYYLLFITTSSNFL